MLTVTMADGTTHDVDRLRTPDFVAFERRFGVSTQTLRTDGRVEHLAFVVWNRLRKEPGIPDDFDDFLAAVDNIDGDDDTDETAGDVAEAAQV